jgi:hypothetical protein
VKHLAERARTELQGVLGPPVTETKGDGHQFHHVHFKVQISLGTKPSRQTTAKRQSSPVPSKSKAKKLKLSSKRATDKEQKKYFS